MSCTSPLDDEWTNAKRPHAILGLAGARDHSLCIDQHIIGFGRRERPKEFRPQSLGPLAFRLLLFHSDQVV